MTNPSPLRLASWRFLTRSTRRSRSSAALPLFLAALGSACGSSEPPEFSFYGERIAPVLAVGCAVQTTGCHVATKDQGAVGNLDLTSFDALMRRRDVLPPSGPYSVGQLLLKGGDPDEIAVKTFDPPFGRPADQHFVAVTTDIRHAGGALLREGSPGYATLKSWITQGAKRNGASEEVLSMSVGRCNPAPGKHLGFDPGVQPDAEAFRNFERDVQPILRNRCAGSTCHGSPQADLYLSCGDVEAASRWNYFVTLAHLDERVSESELLRRPLSKQRGGTFHEGGTIFASTDDADYKKLREFADYMAMKKPALIQYQPADEGLRFFGNYVQPILVQKGCMFQNCHSPSMFHDLKLRGGSQGNFSRIAFDRNYEMARAMLSIESVNPNESRIIAKNLFGSDRDGTGLIHRGGPLFEDFQGHSATPADCTAFDVATQDLSEVPAYCVMVQWHKLERERALQEGEISEPSEHALVWVSRPLDVGDPRDFDTYRPGADLRRAGLTFAANGRPQLGASSSLLGSCGLSAQSADVRGPAVSWDATKLAFAARSSASDPLRIYEANVDGSGCAQKSGIASAQREQNGILTHDFDPAYAPDGRLVFASTRGNVGGAGFDYAGPQRTPSQLAPNANLYVLENGAVRQLSFLLNQEMQPSFMADGRVIFTTEKRAPDFFQLAGRRQNLDGGDYHPLFAQRKSVGFETATEIVELANRNFAVVASHPGARDGAGTVAIVNRSIGPDQDDRDPRDPFYVHSLGFPAPGAFDGQSGAFRSPAALPSAWIAVSCDEGARDLNRGSFDFDLCGMQPETGETFRLGGEAGRADIEAVAVYARVNRGVFTSRLDEPNGATHVVQNDDNAEVHFLDFPLLATLMFDNRRVGRPIDERVGGFDVLESLPPPTSAKTFRDLPAERVLDDDYGELFVNYFDHGHVALAADGSAKVRVPGGHPLVLRVTDGGGKTLAFRDGAPFSGEMVQREEIQFYPGERISQAFRRPLFNGMCAGCHGSITGAELDVAVKIDVLTSASITDSHDADAKPPR